MAFPTTPLLDAFTYSNGALHTVSGGVWLSPVGSPMNVTSNQIVPSVAGGSVNTHASLSITDCEAYITVVTLPLTGEEASLGWLDASGNGYGIAYVHGAPGSLLIRESLAYAPTTLGAAISITLAAGDGFGFRVLVGTNEITGWTRSGAVWTLQGTRTDSTYTTARTLAVSGNGTTERLDDFGGGAFQDIAAVLLERRSLTHIRM